MSLSLCSRIYYINKQHKFKKKEKISPNNKFKTNQLKNVLFRKMYTINNDCHQNKNVFTKSAGFDVFVDKVNLDLNQRFFHIFDINKLNVNKFVEIILLQININFLQYHFSKSGYDNVDKIDFYNFLIIIDEILNDINHAYEDDI
jgi:hypothetical protein